ncbi:MAG: ABC transporter substrate-binding protein [Alphaproteobacteria bacterium]|jgi:branched-chain amino acid transport system substrate-binding protein|nr:ABC transporter substrate-binding protein [Alphaproteobacteria bacterium]
MAWKTGLLGAAALALLAGMAQAQDTGPIRIGVMNDMTGVYADVSGKGGALAARMAAEDFGGKVLGRPIEILEADHQNKPDVGSNVVRQWFDRDGVLAVADVPTSSVALAVNEIAREKKRVFLVSGAASSDLTGKACSPTTIHWTYDTYALGYGTGKTLVEQGGDTWFFLTADYAFGQALERDTTSFVQQGGGKVLGGVRVPLATNDFSSYLLQAQASKAKVIGLANAGGDTINSIKQASEFGIVAGGQRLAGLLMFITDIHALGLNTAQGLVATESFYWNLNDETRAWSKKWSDKMGGGKMPSMVQAGIYGSVMHYLKAMQAANSTDAETVVKKMKEMPVNDFMSKDVKIREDGRVLRDFYLVQVKKPAESKGPWDYYNILATIPGDKAARPLDQGGCAFVKKG